MFTAVNKEFVLAQIFPCVHSWIFEDKQIFCIWFILKVSFELLYLQVTAMSIALP